MLRYCTEPESATVTVMVEGQPVAARSDETVATVLLRLFGANYRTTGVDGITRAPIA